VTDRNEIKRAFKETPVIMGIYKIENLANKKIFIGSSLNIPARFNRHKSELKFGSEGIKELLEDYKKYGEDNFEFSIVEVLKPKEGSSYRYKKELLAMENFWLEKLQPFEKNGYNTKK